MNKEEVHLHRFENKLGFINNPHENVSKLIGKIKGSTVARHSLKTAYSRGKYLAYCREHTLVLDHLTDACPECEVVLNRKGFQMMLKEYTD